jgi:NTE family protein
MKIEDMNIPLSMLATDIINNKGVVFNKGSFYEALRPSISIPTIFTPVDYNGTILIDGGVLNPIPIKHVKRSENDIVVVVNLYGDEDKYVLRNINKLKKSNKKYLSYLYIMSASNIIMTQKIVRQTIKLYKPDIVINIPYNSCGVFDFHLSKELINIGMEVTYQSIMEFENK